MLGTTKIDTCDGRALIAVSGPVGLGQRFGGVFKAILDDGTLTSPSWEAMTKISAAFRPHIEAEIGPARAMAQLIGQEAYNSVLSHSVVAMCLDGAAHVFQFDQQAAPEEASASLPFVTIGSGQQLGDAFMAFFSDVLWTHGKLPSIGQGVLATLWTLEESIRVSPAGLQAPSRIWVLEASASSCNSRELEKSDLDEHYQAIEELKAALRGYKHKLPVPDSAPPKPPPPAPLIPAIRGARRKTRRR
jgi:hypothetical protein